MFRFSVRLALVIPVLILIFSLCSFAAGNVSAPGGKADSAQSMLDALGGEAAGWLNDAGEVFLRSDITLTAPVQVTGGEIVINGAGCMITRGFEEGDMFSVSNGALIFGSSKNTDLEDTLIINGGGEAFGNAGSVIAVSGGAVHFYSGTTLEYNRCSSDGGAAKISGGTFSVYGGTVRFCSAVSGGGFSLSGGELTIGGGQIKNCSASENGGAAAVTGGTFTMTGGTVGGTVITDEYAAEPAVESEAGNNAVRGGGFYFRGGSHTIGGGVIACNTAEYGGGAAVEPETELMLYAGGIVYNKAGSGGGIYNLGTCAHAYAEVAQNEAAEGGGVYNGEGSAYYMQEGVLSSNKSSKDGAGIYNLGLFEMAGGSLNYNESDLSGGGVVNSGTFSLSGGSFGYNKAQYPGRGILCLPGGNVIFSDAVFIGGDNDAALVVPETGENAVLTFQGPFTCTTKVARLTPVTISGGFVLEHYKKGLTLVRTAENNEQELTYYIPLFDVTADSTGGLWNLTDSGKLTPDLPDTVFWLIAGAFALFTGAAVVFVVRARKPKK